MQSRRIGPFNVSAIGLGCMNLSHAYGAAPPNDVAERLLLQALDASATLFDTAALYGFGANETLVGRGRFQPEAFARNLQLLADYRAIALRAGCTPAQLALAWLLAQGADILPIPGTTRREHLTENLAAATVVLGDDTRQALDRLINAQTVHGDRYNAQSQSEVDTEQF